MGTPERILVVDDEENMTYFLSQLLGQQGYQVEVATDGQAAIDRIQGSIYDLVISDIRLPGLDDMAVLKAIRESDPLANVILITAYASVESAVQALREGAYDYLIKPFRAEDVLRSVERALERRRLHTELGHLRQEVQRRYAFHNLVGKSRAMQEVYDLIRRVAPARSAVLIRGESGTGKELVARAIHYNSPRKHRRFVAINCGAIPEPLLESELFGHEKGAFTGAVARRLGHFELASGGTLFLDEIGELSAGTQAKLLRVL
ncbi:MAG: sigma-54-dependent Fis family transcriptional regulator, partial [Deltaproteobacteria bacterium]|nr:sigma-54-dependent Fis family transcriptional regulator [Deltaproteobacteria bacterium]